MPLSFFDRNAAIKSSLVRPSSLLTNSGERLNEDATSDIRMKLLASKKLLVPGLLQWANGHSTEFLLLPSPTSRIGQDICKAVAVLIEVC